MMKTIKQENLIFDGMYGLAVGDALGVPFETISLENMRRLPCTDMVGNGIHRQRAGTWSDDTSMSLCIADSLRKGYNPEDMMKNFVQWKRFAKYTAGGKVFDIGNTCRIAINHYLEGTPLEYCGNDTADGNGNGGLMRVFPIALYECFACEDKEDDLCAFLEPVHESSKLTHAHEIGQICCGLFALTLREWLYCEQSQEDLISVASRAYCKGVEFYSGLGERFRRHLPLFTAPEELIKRSEEELPSWGYALNTWNIALWSVLTTRNYKDCVLKAVNVGGDTDSDAAVAGALAGVIYGKSAIPARWLEKLQNKALIDEICTGFNKAFFEDTGVPEVINDFSGNYAFLRMKTQAAICLGDHHYENAAAAYYALGVPAEYRERFAYLDARKAFKLYKELEHLEQSDLLISERLDSVLSALYAQHNDLRQKLMATGEATIIYDTTGGHDNTLGVCRCKECADKKHKNLYGKALMRERNNK